MADKQPTATLVSDRALEMVMRDVLDGMLELSLESAYANSMEFEIIEIPSAGEAPQLVQNTLREQPASTRQPAAILPFPVLRKVAC